MTFTPTHVLISRTKETPVQLVAGPKGYWLYTEAEAQKTTAPAFEVRPKLGVYCRGQQVVGFRLQPLVAATAAQPKATTVAQ
ncbi:MAG: hypothetical protein DCF21_12995 [Leptolyngbya sp.]|jgi:hypothetical protein|uniref:Uncharacterized protein n=1 Tax=Shackletoniella antarctica TaxID=268115 RepID=A0A2W4WGW7_9CYAN|nr:MAG: hypothetical protein DCF17_04100 [Shackletoniella antarctica]PZV14299.1 MAG: hypothetical protein DCF21_12995 [Leptolyngbya sp.]